MQKKRLGFAKPGAVVTRKVLRGPGKGDTVEFKATSASAKHPGELVPRRVIKDVAPFHTQKTLARGKKPSSASRHGTRSGHGGHRHEGHN